MLALPNDRWRLFVEAYMMTPAGTGNDKGHLSACKAAGFTGTDASLRVTAHRVFHDERVQRAMQEELRRSVVTDGPAARAVMRGIMDNPAHPMQFAAAKTIMDKAIPAMLEIQHNHEHSIAPEMMTKALQLARSYGMPVEKMLGWKLAAQLPKPTEMTTTVDSSLIDAEYVEVERTPEGGW